MADIDSFFSSRNTVRKVSEADTHQLSNYLEAIAAFARTTYKSIYVIDYEKKGFEYVSDNPLFLCGHALLVFHLIDDCRILEMSFLFQLDKVLLGIVDFRSIDKASK